MKYVVAFSQMIDDFKGWLLIPLASIATIVIIIQAFKYMQGASDEKASAVKNIKSTIGISGGIFFLIWLVTEVITRFGTI